MPPAFRITSRSAKKEPVCVPSGWGSHNGREGLHLCPSCSACWVGRALGAPSPFLPWLWRELSKGSAGQRGRAPD